MSELITSKMFKELSQNDRSYLYRSKSTDGFDNFVFIHEYTKEEIDFSVKEFGRVYGMVNDGTRLRVESVEDYAAYYKLKTDILLPKENRTNEVVSLLSLLEKEAKAFFVYINGKKIPDNALFVYASNYGTDIFVPYQYIPSFDGFKVFIESVDFRDKEYIHFYNKKMTEGSVSLTLKAEHDNYFDFENHSNDKILIYINGRLTTDNYTSSVSENTKILTIYYGNMINSEVEIFYNHFITYVKKEIETKQALKTFFVIDNDFESPVHGPIPKRSIGFYKDGLRISIDEIKQEARQIYSLERKQIETYNSTMFYIQDADIHNNQFYASYNSDYYLNMMLGNKKLSDALQNKKTNTIFDQFKDSGELDYSLILTDKDKRYDDNLADQYIDKLYNTPADENYQSLVYELIRRNPSLVKFFLRKFSKTSTNYLIKKDPKSTDPIVIGAKLLTDKNNLAFNIYINSSYIPVKEYELIKENDHTLISFPPELFKNGMNYLEVNETIKENTSNFINYISFTPQDLIEPDSKEFAATLVLEKSIVNQYTDNLEEHMVIFQYIEKINGYLYANDRQIGYTNIKDYIIDETETTYRINFKTRPTRRFIIYFKNFSFSGTIVYDKDGSDAKDALVPIIYGSDNDPLPIDPIGVPDLYVNDMYYTYGVDYVFSTPEDNDAIASSIFSFTRVLKKGDLISYSFDGIANKSLINASNMIYENKYGLLYLSQLEFPFDTDYLDIFIDGKKIFKADIDILSDKLIRIRNHKVPFNDLYIKSKFISDYETYRFLYDAYKEDEFEEILRKLFQKVDPSKFEILPDLPDPEEIYESFDPSVGENEDKEPNQEKETQETKRQNILTAMYMKWLISDMARTVMVNGKPLGSKVYGYFKLYQFDALIDTDIVIDGSKAEIIGEKDIHVNCNIEPYGYAKRMKMILEALKRDGKKDFEIKDIWNLFINHPISNTILPIDFPFDIDERTGWLAHLEDNIDYFPENRKIEIIKPEEKVYDKKITVNTIPESIKAGEGDTNYIAVMHNGEDFKYEFLSEEEISNVDILYDENQKMFKIFSRVKENGNLLLTLNSENAKETKKLIPVEIYKQPFMLIENEDDMDLRHTKTKEVRFDTNITFFVIRIEDKNIVSLLQKKKENRFIITGKNVGRTKVHITSADLENEADFEKIIDINIEPLDFTTLEVDNTNLELHKARIIDLNITDTNAEEISFNYDKDKLEITKELDVIHIKGLEEGENQLEIIARKTDYYDKSTFIDILVKPYPILNLKSNYSRILLIEEDNLTLELETEAQPENINIQVVSDLGEIVTIMKNGYSFVIRGMIIGTGKLVISATDPIYQSITTELPIEILEKPPIDIQLIYPDLKMLYPNKEFEIEIISDAEDTTITEELSDESMEPGPYFQYEKIDHLHYKVTCLRIGKVNLKLTATLQGMRPTTETIELDIKETPPSVDLTFIVDEGEIINEMTDGRTLSIPLNTNCDNIEITFDKENMIEANIREDEIDVYYELYENHPYDPENPSIDTSDEEHIVDDNWIQNILFDESELFDEIPENYTESETQQSETVEEIDNTTIDADIDTPTLPFTEKGISRTLELKALSAGDVIMTVTAKKEGYLDTSLTQEIHIKEKEVTPLTISENEFELNLERDKTIKINTIALDFEYENVNPDNIQVVKQDINTLYIKALQIGSATIAIRATAEYYSEALEFITINVIEKTESNISFNFGNITISEMDKYTKRLNEGGEIIKSTEISIKDPEIVSAKVINEHEDENDIYKMIEITGLKYGETEVYLTIKEDKCLPKIFTILMIVTEKTKLNIAEENIDLKLNESKEIFLDTNIDFEDSNDVFEITIQQMLTDEENQALQETEDPMTAYEELMKMKENSISYELLVNERSLYVVGKSLGKCYITISATKYTKAENVKTINFNVIE